MNRPAQALSKTDARALSVRALLDVVADPEIPVLSIAELGVLREVAVETLGESEGGPASGGASREASERVTVTITPTYSGCPAMTVIEMDIRDVLLRAGFGAVRVETVLSPAWTTDWLADTGREKLRALGIAPPVGAAAGKGVLFSLDPDVSCPRCGSADTHMLSRFGSTACKALYRCAACQEPFDYFKCI